MASSEFSGASEEVLCDSKFELGLVDVQQEGHRYRYHSIKSKKRQHRQQQDHRHERYGEAVCLAHS